MFDSENLKVFDDFNNYNPYELSAITDYCIARHTSLGDELLFCGIPVIYYDGIGFPSSLFDYGQDIVVQNYDELSYKISEWENNPNKYMEKIKPSIINIYGDCNPLETKNKLRKKNLGYMVIFK